MKKRAWISGAIALAMLTLALLFAGNKVQAANLGQGMCGNDAEWVLDTAGTLKITGTGPMTNYKDYDQQPWKDYRDRIKKVTIGSGITSIGAYAFDACQKITTVSIPKTVEEINLQAFYNCDGLTAITIPNSVIYIGVRAFYDCDGLTAITIPDSVVTIDEEAFRSCNSLSTLKLGKGMHDIAANAFRECYNLRNVTFPDNIRYIGENAFEDCNSLTNLTLNADLASGAFYGCDALESVQIRSGCTTIGGSCFSSCGNLTKITLTNSVAAVFDRAFDARYWNGTTIYYYGTQAEWDAYNFSMHDKNIVYCLTYPKITAQPQNKTAETGTTANFSVTATGRSLSYLWQYSKDGGKTWGTWDRKDSINVKATGDRNGYKFRCQVTDIAGTVITSKVVTFKETFGISVNPTPQSVYAKENAVFMVKAGGSGLSYNWQYSKDNGKTWSLWSRAREITVPAEGHRNGFLFRCTVSDNAGNSKTTKAVKLTVLTKITAQPKSVSAAKGETVKFTVKAEGPKLSYKWQFSKDGGKTWASWGTGNSISVVAAAGRNNYRFRCLITDTNGKTTTSKAVTLTIK